MLDMDQGSANSRRSSPGSGASHLTPLRDALDWSPPAYPLLVQPNHASGDLPPFARIALLSAPISPRFRCARIGPQIPRNWPPFSPRLTTMSCKRRKQLLDRLAMLNLRASRRG